jgi:hypothetical protein
MNEVNDKTEGRKEEEMVVLGDFGDTFGRWFLPHFSPFLQFLPPLLVCSLVSFLPFTCLLPSSLPSLVSIQKTSVLNVTTTTTSEGREGGIKGIK